jgi:hypothetical protein
MSRIVGEAEARGFALETTLMTRLRTLAAKIATAARQMR